MEANENGHYRGIHIVIINRANSRVMIGRVFDTYKSSKAFEEFIAEPIPDGYIIVAACQDDCVTNLS